MLVYNKIPHLQIPDRCIMVNSNNTQVKGSLFNGHYRLVWEGRCHKKKIAKNLALNIGDCVSLVGHGSSMFRAHKYIIIILQWATVQKKMPLDGAT